MNKIKYSIAILLIAFFNKSVLAQDSKSQQKILIAEINEPKTIQLLAGLEILGELTSRSSPYFARVAKVKDHGECDGAPETCPMETLYIVVSTYDEYPEQKAYLLPKSYGWKFVKWVSIPKEDGVQSFLTLRLSRQDISKDQRKGQWVETGVDVRVNPWQGFATQNENRRGSQ